jgi:hypothetical protein
MARRDKWRKSLDNYGSSWSLIRLGFTIQIIERVTAYFGFGRIWWGMEEFTSRIAFQWAASIRLREL